MDGTPSKLNRNLLHRDEPQNAKLRRVHLVGIGGAGMRSLADVLAAAGWTVSGSDANHESLAGIAGNVTRGPCGRSRRRAARPGRL